MDEGTVRLELERDRNSTKAQSAALRRELDELFAASADVATDDEHDPEGATIAYERSRLTALLDRFDAHLGEIDQTLTRLKNGTYGTCVSCGAQIGAGRLEARPIVSTCVTCARA